MSASLVADKVKAAGNHVDARVDRSRRSNNPVDAWMRTTHNDHHTFGRFDGQRQLPKFQSARLVRNQCNQIDVRSNLSVPVDEFEGCTRPCRTKAHNFRRCAVVVALFGRQRGVLAVDALGFTFNR